MRTAVLSCSTLKDELEQAVALSQSQHDVYWLAVSAHDSADSLRLELQRSLDALDGYDRVLLCFGFCASSVATLQTRSFTLVIPLIDDCISMLLGGAGRRAELDGSYQSIFITRGWLKAKAGFKQAYEDALAAYDAETALGLMQMLYAHNRRVAVIDTGAYAVDEVWPESARIAELMGLQASVLPGTTAYLEQLLEGPYPPGQFAVIPPWSVIEPGMLYQADQYGPPRG